ncbi:GFA family protein [Rhodobacteraceae bacterium]|nr:GFA family protein [Paracoccaceae bacterium]
MRIGQCLCGKVKYSAETEDTFAVCYCKMCQQWASGVFMGVSTTSFTVTEGETHLKIARTSDWADRAFCTECGSNIYYHSRDYGGPTVALGSLDDTTGLTPRVQYFIDKKPTGFDLVQDTKTMTEAECLAHFST